MSEGKKFKFVNEYGEVIVAWQGEDGKVRFTHSDASEGEHFLVPRALSACSSASDVVLSPEEIHFLLGVWLGKGEKEE